MFKKENLIKILIAIVIISILGAIIIPLALDPKMGFIKKEKNHNEILMPTNNQEEIETIEEDI